ncbi:MAG TPA: hypothetical protein VGJ77_02815 [Gaiellaceae bacterium]|jgi:hypothetical protein
MKRSRIVALLRIVVVVLVFATPAIARPEAASAGFTWDETVVTTTDAGTDPGTVGWTWDESTAPTGTGTDPVTDAGTDGWTWDDDGSAAPSEAAVTEPAP